jgi:hypothetical protein
MKKFINNAGGKIIPGFDLTKVSDGEMPKQHSIQDLFKGTVNIDRPPKDRSVNEDIQEKGAYLG